MPDHAEAVVTRDAVTARRVTGAQDARSVLAFLEGAQAEVGVPLVDEGEEVRLQQLAASGQGAPNWDAVVAVEGEDVVGYAGAVLPPEPGGRAEGDVAPAPDRGPCGPVLGALVAALGRLAAEHGADALVVWMRRVGREHLACLEAEGFAVDRRLGVLGRDLDPATAAIEPPEGVRIRAMVPDADDGAVVQVLARAYEGTADDGWDLDRFAAIRSRDWFRPDDLLLAEEVDSGEVLGLHWLKRRTAGVGEVYNLAIRPDAQGRGLGPVLLTHGLAHLADTGCDEVVLWVDRANEPAVALYTSQGFTTRWDDVRFVRSLGAG